MISLFNNNNPLKNQVSTQYKILQNRNKMIDIHSFTIFQ